MIANGFSLLSTVTLAVDFSGFSLSFDFVVYFFTFWVMFESSSQVSYFPAELSEVDLTVL